MKLSLPSLRSVLIITLTAALFYSTWILRKSMHVAAARLHAAGAQLRGQREQKDAETHHQRVDGTYDDRLSQNLDVILTRTEAELSAIDDDVDSADNRIYAFLALNTALIFGLVGLRDTFQFWWCPLIFLLLSSGFFCWTLWPRSYSYGPNIRQFYARWQYAPPSEVKAQMVGELYAAIEKNRLLLEKKSRPFYFGFGILILSIIVGGVIIVRSIVKHPPNWSSDSLTRIESIHPAPFVRPDLRPVRGGDSQFTSTVVATRSSSENYCYTIAVFMNGR